MKMFTISMIAAGLGLGGLTHQAEAEIIYGGSYAPEGMFAPQKVHVLETESVWSIGAATWKIETMYGPR